MNTWNKLVVGLPTISEERWRIVQRNARWVVRYEPEGHPALWKDLAIFTTEREAIRFIHIC